jgi:hypothetical protein
MSDNPKPQGGSTTSELPRDLPMPTYRYQQDRGPHENPLHNSGGAAAVLREHKFLGCAAARPFKS